MKTQIKVLSIALALGFSGNAMANPQSDISPEEARSIAKEAYIYGASYVDNYRVYFKALFDAEHPLPVYANDFVHLRNLAGAGIKDTPNNDTLFSYTILDLRQEPVVLSVPEVAKDRLYMLQLGEVNTNTLPYISSITTGTAAGNYVVTGADFTGYLPADKFDGVVTTRGQYLTVTGRTQVNGHSDLPSVHKIQDGFTVTPLSTFLGQEAPAAVPEPKHVEWDVEKVQGIGVYDYISLGMSWQLPTLEEMGMLESFAKIGLIPGKTFTTEGMSPKVVKAIEAGLADAKSAILERDKTMQVNAGGGWLFGTNNISSVGDDYLLRSTVSRVTIYPNAPDHALYGQSISDSDGQPLVGVNEYRVTFDADALPPVDAFWSLTMYDTATTAMIPNELDRFSIGDRTENIVLNKDGGITVCMQATKPTDKACNWLPAPESAFYAIMRLYAPTIEASSGNWTPPPIVRLK